MTKIIIALLVSCFSLTAIAQGIGLSAKEPCDRMVAKLELDGKTFLASYKSINREMAVLHAKKIKNAVVKKFGIEIERIDPATCEVLKYNIVEGDLSVWR